MLLWPYTWLNVDENWPPVPSFTGEQLCIYDFSQNMAWSGWKMAKCAKNLVSRLIFFSLSEFAVTTYIVQNRWNLVPRSDFHRGTTLFLWILAKSLISLVKNGQMCRKSYLADEFSPYWVSLWPHTLTYMYQIWPRCSTDIGQQLVLMTFLPWGPFSGVKWAKMGKIGQKMPRLHMFKSLLWPYLLTNDHKFGCQMKV